MKLMAHMVAGYPTLSESEALGTLMLECGVDFLEIQIPFSDPVADGPVIMQANHQALSQGTTPEDCMKLMQRLGQKNRAKLLFMSYFNIAHHYGLEKFCKDAKKSGAYGLIIPDIPYDEEACEHYLALCKKHKLHAIQVISPITPLRRLQEIVTRAAGFVYCVSRTGTTGVSQKISSSLSSMIQQVRSLTKLPIAVGFGISEKKHLQQLEGLADIAVLGSKLVTLSNDKPKLRAFLKHLQTL